MEAKLKMQLILEKIRPEIDEFSGRRQLSPDTIQEIIAKVWPIIFEELGEEGKDGQQLET